MISVRHMLFLKPCSLVFETPAVYVRYGLAAVKLEDPRLIGKYNRIAGEHAP